MADFQNTRFKLAEMATEIQVGRVFVDRCMEQHLQGKLDVPTAAMCKYWTTDLQCKVLDECVQLHGGCDLRGVDLSDCRLREASLVGVDLRKAILRQADLTGARVQDAKLDEADLRGARVDPTFWTTAKLRGAKIDIAQALAYSAAHGLDVHGA